MAGAADERGSSTARRSRPRCASGSRPKSPSFAAETGRTPALATVIVGDDPASEIYVRNKHRACEEVGMRLGPPRPRRRDERGRAARAGRRARARTTTSTGSSSSCRCPSRSTPTAVVAAIDPGKDVDGLTPDQRRPARPRDARARPLHAGRGDGAARHEGVELEGAEAVVVGRSKLVGVPVARLLLAANATVTVCHSRTRDLAAVCRRADVLVAAVGVPRLLGADAVKPGAVVIDVGMNRTEDGLCGDVDFEAAAEVAAAITPVPGGVGPMTIAMLLVNTLAAARARV